ncbi:hypothetical protein JCGZ_20446 [Jatropha curcas]|uniref:Uncharacterized protein n=1 Tax=Jatropha curcas TaxID=180498 RepID=A0A067JZ70_JATCU|nr:uncharacterized protein LOC105645665 [Jatropha curcas]XP_037493840.1 uncharacterized protein LOC105645665 [Jatropha curcas]XP_037493841.1 uncharacterized protein LOC105645665 [Jatropha curcas]KDP25290.1 hypothetical protein JCGZ_20446 [Jatropha curcas]
MATKPLTREEIANTEKKLDMPLDDIIKMSKNTTIKAKKQRSAPNKSQKVFNNPVREKALKVRRYMDSRPFVRQGALAQRRSNFQGNRFHLTTEVARKAAVAPFRNKPFDRNVAANSDKARTGAFMVQRKAGNGGFAAKSPQQLQQQGDGGVKPRPQTLDSRFANMKEERMRVLSRRNNGVQCNGIGGRPRVPWARGRFGN